jgi:hypothetical protein
MPEITILTIIRVLMLMKGTIAQPPPNGSSMRQSGISQRTKQGSTLFTSHTLFWNKPLTLVHWINSMHVFGNCAITILGRLWLEFLFYHRILRVKQSNTESPSRTASRRSSN